MLQYVKELWNEVKGYKVSVFWVVGAIIILVLMGISNSEGSVLQPQQSGKPGIICTTSEVFNPLLDIVRDEGFEKSAEYYNSVIVADEHCIHVNDLYPGVDVNGVTSELIRVEVDMKAGLSVEVWSIILVAPNGAVLGMGYAAIPMPLNLLPLI